MINRDDFEHRIAMAIYNGQRKCHGMATTMVEAAKQARQVAEKLPALFASSPQ